MQNNDQIKGDFASLQEKLPKGIQFEFRNLGEMKNRALSTND